MTDEMLRQLDAAYRAMAGNNGAFGVGLMGEAVVFGKPVRPKMMKMQSGSDTGGAKAGN